MKKVMILTSIFLLAASASGADKKVSEIKVELFNQPCLLQGPADLSVLRQIHAISPEQLFPPSLEKASIKSQQDTFKKSLRYMKTNVKLPQEFQKYTQRMERRLEAFVALFDGLEKMRKSQNTKELSTAVAPYFQNKNDQEFSKIVSELKPNLKEVSNDTLESLKQSIKSGIEPDSEEDFHKALLRAGIQYNCAMDEKSDEKGSEDAAE
jgi:uncharacterized protein YihD (DUF1040 family)